MRRTVAVGLLSILVAMIVGGCNLFSFTAPSEDTVADLVHDGRVALRDGDYATAIEKFNLAIDQNPNDPYARWGVAKAYLRQSGYTSISIMGEISSFQDGSLPFSTTGIDSANALYQGVIHANENLKAIYTGIASNSELYDTTISLDYTGCLAIQGLLLFRDTDANDTIDSRDFSLNAILDAINGFQFGDESTWFDQMTAEQQQAMLDNVDSLLTNSADVLNTFLTALASDTTDSVPSGFDTENLDSILATINEGFLDNYGGGGGGGVASWGGASKLRSFSQGGSH